jgi:hypothetical protein
MVKQMAVKQHVKVHGKDLCAFCGHPLVSGIGLLAFVRPRRFETAWDGQKWVPYHCKCWEQLRYQHSEQ